jgi:hypothetical protein
MKKLLATFLIALLSGGIAVAAAYQGDPFTQPMPTQYPKVKVLEGIAFDKKSGEAVQAIFLKMIYGDRATYYLIIGEKGYSLKEVSTSIVGPGTEVFQYESEDGDLLTILIQRFQRWGHVSISGDFKSYLITFKPIYRGHKPRPICGRKPPVPERIEGIVREAIGHREAIPEPDGGETETRQLIEQTTQLLEEVGEVIPERGKVGVSIAIDAIGRNC